MKQLTKENNFYYLFFSLILLLFSASVVAEYPSGWSKELFSIFTLFMLVVSIKSLNTDSSWKRTVYLLIVATIVLSGLNHLFEQQLFIYMTLFVLLFFFVGSFVINTRQIFLEGDIDGNKIIGSITLYILLGLIWAVIYLILLTMDPHAFSGIEPGSWQQIFSRVAYYSFVTLTTLGYGDVLPTNHIAEFFVYIEAILGVFYMAVIVASLISLRLAMINEEKKAAK